MISKTQFPAVITHSARPLPIFFPDRSSLSPRSPASPAPSVIYDCVLLNGVENPPTDCPQILSPSGL